MKRKWLIGAVITLLFLSSCDLTGEDTKKIAAETGKVAGQVTDVVSAVDTTALTGDQIKDIINQVNAGVGATAPWNPYAVPIQSGLGLLSVVLGMFLKKKTTEATIATKTLGAVVNAVETAKAVVIKPLVSSGLSAAGLSVEGRNLITSLK